MRTDLQKYASACTDLVNGIVRPQGGVSKRPGLEHVAVLSGDGLLVPFQYSTEESSVLVFTDHRLYVYTEGVIDGVPSEGIESPYALGDLPELKFVQSADVLFLTHRKYAVRKLMRTSVNGAAHWSFEVMTFYNANRMQVRSLSLANASGSHFRSLVGIYELGAHGALLGPADSSTGMYTRNGASSSLATLAYAVSVVLDDGSESQPMRAAVVTVGSTWPSGAKIAVRWLPPVGNLLMAGFGETALNSVWAGVAEDEFQGPGTNRLRRFTMLSKSAGNKSITIDGVTYAYKGAVQDLGGYEWIYNGASVYTATNTPGTSGDAAKAYATPERDGEALTISKVFSDSYTIGHFWVWTDADHPYEPSVHSTKDVDGVHGEGGKTSVGYFPSFLADHLSSYKSGSYYFYNYYTDADKPQDTTRILTRGATQDIEFPAEGDALSVEAAVATVIQPDRIIRYYVYKDVCGYFGYIGSVDEPGVTADNGDVWREFQDDYISPDYTQGVKSDDDPFGSEDSTIENPVGTNPSACAIFQQRLVLAGTEDRPQTLWMSESGAFNSFGTHNPLISSDAIEATLDSRRMNPIRHVLHLKDGLVMTSGAEYLMNSGDSSGAVSPTAISVKPQSYWGCGELPPITIGSHALFLLQSGLRIRDLAYRYTEDSYVGEEMTILADDIISSPCVDWTFQQDPNSCVWLALDDGSLLSFTYLKEQEVYAWARHESAGAVFRSCCTVHENGRDRTYFLVDRPEGASHNYRLERLALYDFSLEAEECNFLDRSALVHSDTPVQSVTLPHLAGADGIMARIDGVFHAGLSADSSGVVSLPASGSDILVGIPYQFLVETVDPEIQAEGGAAVLSDKRSVAEIVLAVRETAQGLKAGPDASRLEEVKFPYQPRYGSPLSLFTGRLALPLAGRFRDRASVVIAHDEPTPCTVLCVQAKVNIG